MLDQAEFETLRSTFEQVGMRGAVALIDKLRALEAQRRMPACIELHVPDREKWCYSVIPLGTLDGTHTIWDSLQSFTAHMDQLGQDFCRDFDNILAGIAGRPIAHLAPPPGAFIHQGSPSGLPN